MNIRIRQCDYSKKQLLTSKDHGFSLTESLVALFLLSMGMMMAMHLMLNSQTQLRRAEWRNEVDTIATTLREHRIAHRYSLQNERAMSNAVKASRDILHTHFPNSDLEWRCCKTAEVGIEKCQVIFHPPNGNRDLKSQVIEV